MGNLINPISSRLGYVKYWDSTWAAAHKNNYSLNSTIDLYLKKYFVRLMTMVEDQIKDHRGLDLVSYKTISLKNEFYIIIYYAASWSQEDHEALLELFASRARSFININTKKRSPIPKYASGRQHPSKFKKEVSSCVNQTRISLMRRAYAEFVINRSRLLKYDAYRRRIFSNTLFLRSAATLQNSLCSLPQKHITGFKNSVRTEAIGVNAMWAVLLNYLFYTLKLKFIKDFFSLSLAKYLPCTSFRFVFVQQTRAALSAELLSYYVTTRLQTNFPLRPLIKTFIRQLRFEMHVAGILGFKIVCSGRFERRGRASYEWKSIGHTANTNYELELDYSLRLVTLTNSICAIKIWLVKPSQNKKLQIF